MLLRVGAPPITALLRGLFKDTYVISVGHTGATGNR